MRDAVEAPEKDVDKMGGLKTKIYIKSDFFLKKNFPMSPTFIILFSISCVSVLKENTRYSKKRNWKKNVCSIRNLPAGGRFRRMQGLVDDCFCKEA